MKRSVWRAFAIAGVVGASVFAWWMLRPVEMYVRVSSSAAKLAPGTRISVEQDGSPTSMWSAGAVDVWVGPMKLRGRGKINLHVLARGPQLVTEATVPLVAAGNRRWNIDITSGGRPQVSIANGGLTWLLLGPPTSADTLWVKWTRGDL